MSKSTVEVDLAYLNALEDDSRILQALVIGGVDNWEWYGESLRQAGIFDEEDDE